MTMDSFNYLFGSMAFSFRREVFCNIGTEGQCQGQKEKIIRVLAKALRAPFQGKQEQGSGNANNHANQACDDEPFEDADQKNGFFCNGFFHFPDWSNIFCADSAIRLRHNTQNVF